MSGSGYSHISSVNVIGGEYGWRIESNANAVPSAIRTAMEYTGAPLYDGNSVHSVRLSDIEALAAWRSGMYIEASAAGYGVNRVMIFGFTSQLNGRAGANTDFESGLYLRGQTGRQDEGVQIFGLWASSNNMHGVILDGNVGRCEFHGKASENGNGTGSPPTAYQLYLRNGTISGAPSENKAYMALNATGSATNQALKVDTLALGNELHLDTFTYTYTLGNAANLIFFKTNYGYMLSGNTLYYAPTTLATLGTPVNGTIMYCSDCAYNSNPCTGSSTGAIAKRVNNAWRCD